MSHESTLTAAAILYPNKETITEEVKQIEESKTTDAIAAVIDTSWAGSNEEQMKIVQLLKGIALSDDEVANKFMKKLDSLTSGLSADDYK